MPKNFGSFGIPWGQPERRLMKTIWGNYKLALLSISCMLNAALSGSFIVVETEGWRRQLADGRTSSIISWLSKQRQSEWPHSRERHYCQFHHIFYCVISTKKCTFHSTHNGARNIILSQNRAPVCWKAHSIALMIFKQTFAEWEIVPLFKVLG